LNDFRFNPNNFDKQLIKKFEFEITGDAKFEKVREILPIEFKTNKNEQVSSNGYLLVLGNKKCYLYDVTNQDRFKCIKTFEFEVELQIKEKKIEIKKPMSW